MDWMRIEAMRSAVLTVVGFIGLCVGVFVLAGVGWGWIGIGLACLVIEALTNPRYGKEVSRR